MRLGMEMGPIGPSNEHWPTYTWRPLVGILTGLTIFGCYFILPLLHIPVPVVPETVWVMLGTILGIASWHRGKMQVNSNNTTGGS